MNETINAAAKVNYDTLPRRMQSLPRDERGYPVPWFVAWIDPDPPPCRCRPVVGFQGKAEGIDPSKCPLHSMTLAEMTERKKHLKPEFRAIDPEKLVRAVKEKLCWVCGERLGVYLAFVAGPMCGINRTSAEPPSHVDCARWSAVNCPFLSNPRMVRREDDLVNNAKFAEQAAGRPISRNPGVAMVWITRSYEVFNDGNDKPLIQMGEPESVEWYCEGRAAARAEVDASIKSGLPNLEALAAKEKGGMEFLNRQIARFQKYLP